MRPDAWPKLRIEVAQDGRPVSRAMKDDSSGVTRPAPMTPHKTSSSPPITRNASEALLTLGWESVETK
jgi:hypothetical protein